jgi:hypothetical protein
MHCIQKAQNRNFVKVPVYFLLLQDGFAPPEEVDGDVPPPNEEEEY